MGNYLVEVKTILEDCSFYETSIVKDAPSAEEAVDYAICLSTGTDDLKWSEDEVYDPVMDRTYYGKGNKIQNEHLDVLEIYFGGGHVYNHKILAESGNYLEYIAQ